MKTVDRIILITMFVATLFFWNKYDNHWEFIKEQETLSAYYDRYGFVLNTRTGEMYAVLKDGVESIFDPRYVNSADGIKNADSLVVERKSNRQPFVDPYKQLPPETLEEQMNRVVDPWEKQGKPDPTGFVDPWKVTSTRPINKDKQLEGEQK